MTETNRVHSDACRGSSPSALTEWWFGIFTHCRFRVAIAVALAHPDCASRTGLPVSGKNYGSHPPGTARDSGRRLGQADHNGGEFPGKVIEGRGTA
jgi:hypothetical protein